MEIFSALWIGGGLSETSSSLNDGGGEPPCLRRRPYGARRGSPFRGGGRGYVGEEGPFFGRRPPYEAGRLPEEDVGKEVFGLAAVGDDLAVLVDSVVVELLLV